MLMGNKCCATDVLNRFTIFFIIISKSTIEVVFKKTSWTNIDESVQVFKQRLNEFQVLEPLLVAMVSDLWNRFCIFFVQFLFYQCLYINLGTRNGLHIPGGVGQGTCRVGA